MNNKRIVYKPIGIIRSPFKSVEDIPIQPAGANGIIGEVKVNKIYAAGLENLGDFSHIILIYHFHLSKGHKLKVVPFMDIEEHGIFATRAPVRPNHIGISVVKVRSVEANVIWVENIDVADRTPLLDIKPYISRFDNVSGEKNGWYSNSKDDVRLMRADSRFK